MDYNKQIANYTFNLFNDRVSSTIFNVTCELKADIAKAQIIFKISLPENDNDRSYSREFFKTSIDAVRIANGIQGNSILRSLAGSFLKAIDFEIKFPFKKVQR